MPAAKATGLDSISCKVLKLSAEIIAPHIVNICNTSIETAQFPRSWKKARVVPLYKSGDSNDVTNYRPISVLPVLSKLLKRHVYNHFYAYLAESQLLQEEQSGFRQGSYGAWKSLNSMEFHLLKIKALKAWNFINWHGKPGILTSRIYNGGRASNTGSPAPPSGVMLNHRQTP